MPWMYNKDLRGHAPSMPTPYSILVWPTLTKEHRQTFSTEGGLKMEDFSYANHL